ncbi:MAG: endonuclease domain-containing protein [Alphaproteobacteria bacterium]
MPTGARIRTARKLRRDATNAEQVLWRALRASGWPWKFRRQHPIGESVADFACVSGKLVIELDGGQHAEMAEADARRSDMLAHHGYRVIRFWNHDVLGNLDGVMETIRRELENPPHPDPLPPEGRRGRSR